MKLSRLLILTTWFLTGGLFAATLRDSDLLWYKQPAAKWTEALPIGNGQLGAMIFGGTSQEQVQFNEATLWAGKPHDYARPEAFKLLPELRRLIFEGDIAGADKLAKPGFLSDPIRQKPYQAFGDLRIAMPGHEKAEDYRRELDLDAGLVRVSYRIDGVDYTREYFASYPDKVLVIRLQASAVGKINLRAALSSIHKNSVSQPSGNRLTLGGRVQDDGLTFESTVQVRHVGGQLKTLGNELELTGADSAEFLLCAATSFRNFQAIDADPHQRCLDVLAKAETLNGEQLLARHREDYTALYQRSSLHLPAGANAAFPTDKRVALQRTQGLAADPSFAALHFHFGRYLLIASSRQGGQPANLQGIWNDSLNPPWESKWTTNINCQMNYWPAELTNLRECHEPLFDMIDDLVLSGRRSAKAYWNSRGWVVHHNTDLWRGTAPINNLDGIWPTGAAWLCYHLWEHYLFTRDEGFLEKRALPVMKEASLFFLDSLVPEPKHGWLVTCPSFSPEISHDKGTLTAGPTMDVQLITALFDATLRAGQILGDTDPLLEQIAQARAKLPPPLIGKHGQLQEWLDDLDRPNNNHRHMSPLWALYPGADLNPQNPKTFEAAKVLLKWRGEGSTGWSFAWRVPLWARVGDGDMALRQAAGLYAKKTLPNLFDLCGPFQIDGNFGTTAGLAEMLLQSHLSVPGSPDMRILQLLPALPSAWPEGSVSGLRARGAYTIDLAWAEGKLTKVRLRADKAGICVLSYGKLSVSLECEAGATYILDSNLKSAK